MKFEDMTIRQLISECEKMQKQLKAFENRISTMNTMSENIKILGRQNKKLKRDNERYRKLLDRNPNKGNLSDWKLKIIRNEVIRMKFDICDVFSQDEYDEIRKFLLKKLNHIPDEATISDVSMELHKIVEDVLYEYEINAMIWEVDLMERSD